MKNTILAALKCDTTIAEFAGRRMLQVGIGSVVAAGVLAGASNADARTTQIQILTRTTAFGGYSLPGVGRYEVIKGVAAARSNGYKSLGSVDVASPSRVAARWAELATGSQGAANSRHNVLSCRP